jgi:hypothetical protein
MLSIRMLSVDQIAKPTLCWVSFVNSAYTTEFPQQQARHPAITF